MLIITSLPKWETSHCHKDLKLVFPVSWGRGGINFELQRCGWVVAVNYLGVMTFL